MKLELITFEILAAERLRLMGFDNNQLIIDCFANVVNILLWLFRTEKYESNYLENTFPEKESIYCQKHIAMTKAI